MLVPTWAVGWGPPVDSRILIPLDTLGGVLEGVSLRTLGGWSAMHYLFMVRPTGGGGIGQKPIDGHCTFGHHLVALTDLRF